MKNFRNLLRSHQSLDPSPGLPLLAWTRSRFLLPPDGPGPAPGFSSSRMRVLSDPDGPVKDTVAWVKPRVRFVD